MDSMTKASWRGLYSVVVLMIMIVIHACSSTQPTALKVSPTPISPTDTPSVSETPKSSATVIPTPTSTPIATLTPMPLLASLPPGQYVVYSGYDKVSRAFYVVSMDGTFQGKLVPQGSIDARLSPDGKRIVFSDSESIFSQTTLLIFDLEQNTTTKILVERGCVHPSWGPDGQTLAIECRNIYVLSLQNGTRERLLPEYDPEQIEVSPEWSPDGKWIAYYRRVSPFPVDGPYLVDASCLADPLTCNAKTHRLVMLEGVLAWSPDSRYVAIGPFDENKSNTISIFDTQSSQLVRKLKVELGYGPINTMSWSPDGKWIAFTPRDANGIFLIPAESGEPTLLYADFDTEGKQVVFWLTVP